MFNKKSKKNSYGIVGLGRFGMELAHELAESGADILVIDEDEEKVREMRDYTENAFVAKNIDRKTLSETGIHNCDVAIVCVSDEMDTSILTTLYLVELGVPTVISKAVSLEHGKILEKLGADVVYPERDMALRLAHRLEASKMLDFIQLSEQLNIIKLMIPNKIIGKTILEVNLRSEFGINIIAIENNAKLIEIVKPDYIFCKGDILFVSGSKDGINKLSEWSNND